MRSKLMNVCMECGINIAINMYMSAIVPMCMQMYQEGETKKVVTNQHVQQEREFPKTYKIIADGPWMAYFEGPSTWV